MNKKPKINHTVARPVRAATSTSVVTIAHRADARGFFLLLAADGLYFLALVLGTLESSSLS